VRANLPDEKPLPADLRAGLLLALTWIPLSASNGVDEVVISAPVREGPAPGFRPLDGAGNIMRQRVLPLVRVFAADSFVPRYLCPHTKQAISRASALGSHRAGIWSRS
jgi:hypothetical protein